MFNSVLVDIENASTTVGIRIRIPIWIQRFLGWIRIRSLKVRIRIRIQEKLDGFGFESGFKISGSDHTTTIQTRLAAFWGLLYPAGFEFGLEAVGIRIQIQEKRDGFGFSWIRIRGCWIRIGIRDAWIRTSLLHSRYLMVHL